MEKKRIAMLLLLSSGGLTVAGIVFLCISMFGEIYNNWALCAALVCVLLSILFNIVLCRMQKRSKEE